MEEKDPKYRKFFDPEFIQSQIDEKGALWWAADETYMSDLIEFNLKYPAPKTFLEKYYETDENSSSSDFKVYILRFLPKIIKSKYNLHYSQSFGNWSEITYDYDIKSNLSKLKNVIFYLRPHSISYYFNLLWEGEHGEEIHFSKLPELNLPIDYFKIEPVEPDTIEKMKVELRGLNLKRQPDQYKFKLYMPKEGYGLDVQMLVEPVLLYDDFHNICNLIANAVNTYNEEAEVKKHGLIHTMNDGKLDNQYIKFEINLGTGYDGVNYILKSLNDSDLKIRNVRVF
jgi:hypothetical protein